MDHYLLYNFKIFLKLCIEQFFHFYKIFFFILPILKICTFYAASLRKKNAYETIFLTLSWKTPCYLWKETPHTGCYFRHPFNFHNPPSPLILSSPAPHPVSTSAKRNYPSHLKVLHQIHFHYQIFISLSFSFIKSIFGQRFIWLADASSSKIQKFQAI